MHALMLMLMQIRLCDACDALINRVLKYVYAMCKYTVTLDSLQVHVTSKPLIAFDSNLNTPHGHCNITMLDITLEPLIHQYMKAPI